MDITGIDLLESNSVKLDLRSDLSPFGFLFEIQVTYLGIDCLPSRTVANVTYGTGASFTPCCGESINLYTVSI